ncbi:putative lipid phosphatase CDC1 NDAI_0A01100 [Naumovozyma dairenensis CBS 421]|uniref:Calcineurin-like phosphoesterase domain-containing protein n=1 Tax=Naumovozyma dairenensis (strain ATCC 10597 / BCRC 20456 / CBS 421 / NBRC 0211 / NRRL Y-12639) TaxID=1071378 RepID=G0W380_NAUDC|nr:hypothetical protein NDAI_0A01100 [Naumovozyma dairenensis CBS 421]CCD22268.1 hypothetical protein NDAI_0A01100 [Naumovozyma dairenensis CBS 421]
MFSRNRSKNNNNNKKRDEEKEERSEMFADIEKGIPVNNIEIQNDGKVRVYWRYIVILFTMWLLLIHYYESIVVKRAMRKCQWSRWETWSKGTVSHKVALFADPQIMDAHSYPGRPVIVNYLTRVMLDHYHERNWKYVHYYLDPDTNFFLGDLFDGGRYWDDDYWLKEYTRFNKIFPKKQSRMTVMSLPGNHDIGFGDTVIESSLERFTTYFGDPSAYVDVGNHTFVLVDTISLSDKLNSNVSEVPKKFLNEFAMGSHPMTKILLTHVPLWRNANQQKCGSLRESKKAFPIQKGDQYQTVIDLELSQEVLSKIQPSLLFSGDDHDYCQIQHSYTANGMTKHAEEITVKSCAMNMGISRPAIQLLSLYNPNRKSGNDTYQTEMCYLPDPYKPIKMYLLMTIVSLSIFGYIMILPRSFNKRIATKIGKISDYNLNTKNLNPTEVYMVDEHPSKVSCILNLSILSLMVLILFYYYYVVI